MGNPNSQAQWTTSLVIAVALASISASSAVSLYFWRRISKSKSDSNGEADARIHELEVSLKAALNKSTAERQGRIRAQQALRKALSRPNHDTLESSSYPMLPIALVRSCFSTRNGTPRQPLLVPLAKASLIFDPSRVPQASLQGFEGYSHCWIVYVFHLNTDLDKLWRSPSQSGFKAKVRVPRLKGERVGVFATRSPHRPCPIGLTVAKVEAIQGHAVLLSGVDLVDGTPVLDVKPYLPYCDSIQGATVPEWVEEDSMLAIASVNFSDCFSSTLSDCWSRMEKKSLYHSPDEFKLLIRQVLSWDIRSVSQRNRTHHPTDEVEANISRGDDSCLDNEGGLLSPKVVYHVVLEGFDVSYEIDSNSNVLVQKVAFASPMWNKITKEQS